MRGWRSGDKLVMLVSSSPLPDNCLPMGLRHQRNVRMIRWVMDRMRRLEFANNHVDASRTHLSMASTCAGVHSASGFPSNGIVCIVDTATYVQMFQLSSDVHFCSLAKTRILTASRDVTVSLCSS